MNTHYYCRHCGSHVGTVGYRTESLLDDLSPTEKLDTLHYDEYGNMYVKAICQYCQETLDSYPHYHEYELFIQ
ncbi:DUF2757 family protein [Ectobacillus antri]|jgi:hypothetical protein|uniref:DUF2757 family protein n=1 Tax=Ectobacillus antri TaxID=2486280 RepID=A0ABT6H958_9BACI|nr:anti-sigma-F factor Fin [Ectobacillus antri]MDG4657978.1 DUF2757 family protein [Ectobacillus antri]MDG5755036.1 DUF2757 family protein [Ectobacillus antri]